ncbi:MAG: ABC transporter permease [Oscillospiraceae bacterium]|nr:ABC transporter permease [Oscillospiraceae bacterium]
MLFRLSLSNIRRSLRDYAIYFFTLIIGVSVFYVFNAIGTQAAMLRMSESQYQIIRLLESLLSGMSVFVAGVLALLIVYASRFLMKRRNREFALYMTLGMSKAKISAILLLETLIIGIGSLGVGLVLGIGLSQLSSALVANLFEADMSAYRFSVSGEAIGKTILYFAVMYLIVMLFNSVVVTKMKLITLMQSGKKSEQIKLKNPVLCIVIFLIAAAILGYAYYQIGYNPNAIDSPALFMVYTGMAFVGTFLVFWSVSGMMLRILKAAKGIYHRGLNCFTFRQISSKVNTMVFSMTIICMMMLITICTLSSAFSIRNSLNRNLKTYCAADCELSLLQVSIDENGEETYVAADLSEVPGLDLTGIIGDSVQLSTYFDPGLTMETALGIYAAEAKELYPMLFYDNQEEIIRVSDYNALSRLYGREELTVESDEYILLCDYPNQRALFDTALASGSTERTIFGRTLHARYDKCQDGFVDLCAQAINMGIFVVADDVVDADSAYLTRLIGNYTGETAEEKEAQEKELLARIEQAQNDLNAAHPDEYYLGAETKIQLYESAVGLGAVVTFLGLYIGIVFLIACGAILALKELSESVDSIGRYEMLRKIGAEESAINGSLFVQTGIFFLLPLLLGALHSVFGMKFATYILNEMGTERVGASILSTVLMILVIYGGYFLVTYLCGKGIIKGRS